MTTSQALSDVKVLDLTHHIAGPYCTKLLADYGADVIKIERPGTGDPARRTGPFLKDQPHSEKSGFFLHLNANKRGITLDLKCETGKKIFKELLNDVDILVENFAPRVMPGLGLGYGVLSKIRPELVMVSISNFGQTGPYRDLKASDLVLYGMGHEQYSTGWPQYEPAAAAPRIISHIGGLAASMYAMGAFWAARHQGVGQHVDVSLMEIMLTSMDRRFHALLGYSYSGKKAVREAPRLAGLNRPLALNPCADGYFHCTIGADRWEDFKRLVGESWVQDPAMKPPIKDVKATEEFDRHFLPWCMRRTKREIMLAFQQAGLLCAAVNDIGDVCRDPNLAARDFFIEADHPAAGRFDYPGAPFKMTETPWQVKRPAPLLGEHNAEVYGKLGYTEKDLNVLRNCGVI